jgi:hypothetical protein
MLARGACHVIGHLLAKPRLFSEQSHGVQRKTSRPEEESILIRLYVVKEQQLLWDPSEANKH